MENGVETAQQEPELVLAKPVIKHSLHAYSRDGEYLGFYADMSGGQKEMLEGGGVTFSENAPQAAAADPTLTRPQFEFLLSVTGLDEVWDTVQAQVQSSGDKQTLAALKAERVRSKFTFSHVVAQVQTFAPLAPEGVDLSPEALKAAWDQAAAFKGLGK